MKKPRFKSDVDELFGCCPVSGRMRQGDRTDETSRSMGAARSRRFSHCSSLSFREVLLTDSGQAGKNGLRFLWVMYEYPEEQRQGRSVS